MTIIEFEYKMQTENNHRNNQVHKLSGVVH